MSRTSRQFSDITWEDSSVVWGERWTEGIVFRISLGKYELSCTERGYHQGLNNSRHIRINMLWEKQYRQYTKQCNSAAASLTIQSPRSGELDWIVFIFNVDIWGCYGDEAKRSTTMTNQKDISINLMQYTPQPSKRTSIPSSPSQREGSSSIALEWVFLAP